MAPKRTVLATDIAKTTGKWSIWGALQVGVAVADGKIQEYVVLYRTTQDNENSIQDITSSVTVTSSDPKSGNFHLSKAFNSDGPEKHRIGFEVDVEQLWDKDNAGFDNAKFTFEEAGNSRTVSWRGAFADFNDSPLEVIKAGSQPLDGWIEDFLDITPLDDDDNDKPSEWTSNIFAEISQHALPAKAKSLFFDDDIPWLGSKFLEEDCPGDDLPYIVSSNTYIVWIPLSSILNENRRLFELTSMHFLCRDLSHADWLDDEFRSQLPDKVGDFFDMVGVPPSASPDEVQRLKDRYGKDKTAAREFEQLRRQYSDAIRRCYYFAYICHDNSLEDVLRDASEGRYKIIRDTLLSDNFKEHLLPALMSVGDEPDAMPISAQLAQLSDKLSMYRYHLHRENDCPENKEDVDYIISELAIAAKRSGLVRDTLIDFKTAVRKQLQRIGFGLKR